MFRWVDTIGAAGLGLARYALHLVGLLYLSVKVIWTDRDMGQRAFIGQILMQIYFTGVQAIGPVVVMALAIGPFAVVQGVGGVGALSSAEGLGRMVTIVVLREIAPLLTGVVAIARSATAIAAELGVMRVQNEIEALEVMGVSPIRYLVTPRIFGGVLALFGLNVLFNIVALAGGFLIAQLLVSIPASLFFGAVGSAVTPVDVIAFGVKVLFGGLSVFLIACYHGMGVGRSPTEVPVAVSRASLNALVLLVVMHATVSLLTVASLDRGGLLGIVL